MAYILSVNHPHPFIGPTHGIEGGNADHDEMMWKMHVIFPHPEPALIDAVEGGELQLGLLPLTSRGWVWLLQILPGYVVEAPFTPALQHPANRRIPQPGPEGTGRMLVQLIDEKGTVRALRFVALPASLYRTVTALYTEGVRGAWKFSRRNWDAIRERHGAKHPTPADALAHAIEIHTVPAIAMD